jgi:toxin-antitoxin system PIN domain toxin
MILVDANLLLYAYNRASDHHKRARFWLEEALAQSQPVLLPWMVILAFLRISTSSRIWRNPLRIEEAIAAIDALLARVNVTIPQPGVQHWPILSEILKSYQCRDALVMDAHLGAIAIKYGATICTNDRDFSRFPDLKVFYPLD